MPTTSPRADQTPLELKELGNKLYTERKYDEAIDCYTQAISKNPIIPTYFTNRALCYLKKSQWELVIKDCKRALDMDSNLVKAHFFMGQALQELDSMDECVACLQRASDLAQENKQHFGDNIALATRIAKRKRWNAAEVKRMKEEIELQSYLNILLREETERQIEKLTLGSNQTTSVKNDSVTNKTTDVEALSDELTENKERNEVEVNALATDIREEYNEAVNEETTLKETENFTSKHFVTNVRPLTEEELEVKVKEIKDKHEKSIVDLNFIFSQVDDRRKKREVPDYLCGKISFELLRDPVVTPSGITYDRKDIEAHIQRVGHFDPVTRATLTQDQLIPNYAMKDVVDGFLAENAWAMDF